MQAHISCVRDLFVFSAGGGPVCTHKLKINKNEFMVNVFCFKSVSLQII
jgi:hypothetical protein